MTIRRVFAVLLFVQLFNIAVRPTLDPDMWWHLRTGELIWQSGIPRHDVFSFTVPDHQWITHEWLSQAVMWAIYKAGGLTGLATVFALFDAVAFWLVYTCCDGQPYLAGLLVIVGEFAASPSFGVRPQTFNLLLAAAFVHVVERVRKRQLGARALLLLPLLAVVWANLHSGYLFGVLLLITYAVGDGLAAFSGAPDAPGQLSTRTMGGRCHAREGGHPGGAEEWIPASAGMTNRADPRVFVQRTPGLSRSEVRMLMAVAVACFAAALLNPNGWELWRYPFGTLGSAAMQQNIAEWRSPDFHTYIYWPFALLMAVGVVSWVVGQTRPSWTDLLLFLGTAFAGLMSVRHIALFAVVSTPIIARSLNRASRGTALYALLTAGRCTSSESSSRHARESGHPGWGGGVDSRLRGNDRVPGPEVLTQSPTGERGGALLTRRKAQLNWALLVVGLLASGAWSVAKLEKNDSAIAKEYPVAAVDFLKTHGLAEARGYNSYIWGGYLIWRGLPVFVDGRADVYGDEFLSYYLKTFRLMDDWRKPLDDFAVAYVLVERSNPLATLLAANQQWREAYGDDVARIFVRVEKRG